MFRKIKILLLITIISHGLTARDGMWIPVLLEKYNIGEMQSLGFKLSAQDVYSINKASMKDAVLMFGSGCTGELISGKGLLVTNHHCGYSVIQSHSSINNDYLTNGFWAMSSADELVNPTLKVTFLKRMEDVTLQVLAGVNPNMSVAERKTVINKNIKHTVEKAVQGTHYSASVEPFYYGNQYFLFVNEVFNDVRLVGAPPSAIGKFGGDTDNWMWPRHTGDFSLFRIYAGKDNKPAPYSPDNVPYKSPVHFPVSLKGVQEGDFTMVFGYPGSTNQYVVSHHIKMLLNSVYPGLVELRTAKLNAMNAFMESDPAVRIKYASKNASLANSWKRWKGEINGLNKLNVLKLKQQYEQEFLEWINESEERKNQMGNLLADFENYYTEYAIYRKVRDYLLEFIGRAGVESARLAGSFEKLAVMYNSEKLNEEDITKEKARLKNEIKLMFKDYHKPIDMEIAKVSLEHFKRNVPGGFLPTVYSHIDTKFNGEINRFVTHYFNKSAFTNENSANSFLNDTSARAMEKLENDPAYILFNSFRNIYYEEINPRFQVLQNKIDSLNLIYMAGRMQFEPQKVFYPDANSTLRVSYGQVQGYEATDGIYFKYFSTLEGIIEKDNPDIYDYRVPEKLKELHKAKDYGRYGVNGTVPVCFIANNHTTGGNSGSPVINGRGELIGINFDRAWEGVMSDLMFNPEQSRNISLDIRYVLFIIDKFAGAGYLLDEMTLVN